MGLWHIKVIAQIPSIRKLEKMKNNNWTEYPVSYSPEVSVIFILTFLIAFQIFSKFSYIAIRIGRFR